MFNFMRSHVSFASCALVWLACSANECAADTLIITSEVRFSELDGSSDDNDGMANGVLALSSLGVGGGGRLLLDVPRAVLELDGSLVLWLDGSIRTPPGAVPAIGPALTVRAGAVILLVANSSIVATGSNIGGAVFLCAPRGIGLWHNARISTGDAPDATSAFGGFVGLQSARAISLNSANTRISADGLTGGAVRLVTCGSSPNSVLIRGTVSAIGIERRGGSLEIEARQGGIVFDGDSGSIDATGASADGTVSLTAGTTVNPIPPPVNPQPLILVGQPSSEPCDDCAFDFVDDCNRNGIPDDQDLDECTGDPACDDCNLNGVLDTCDIASGNSLDVSPKDGVPDECSEFTGGCVPPTENWSCFDNWDLTGDTYPDDLASAPGVQVTLGPGDSVLLDVSVLIPTLRLLDGALLKMTQAGAQGDLGFSAPATLLNQGTIHVAHDRVLGADGGLPPSIVFGAGGTLTKDPTSLVSASALLRGAELVLEPGSCAAQRDGAHLELVDDMSVVLDGDLVLEGASFADCSAVNRTSGGVTPPPKLGAQDSVTIDLGGALRRNVDYLAADNGTAPGTLTLGSVVEVAILPDAVVRVRGDFNNRSVSPGLFNWINGTLVMRGDAPRRLEVAGVDVGATLEGFQVDAHTNFSMKTLRIAANSDVTFENRIANTVSEEPCAEAWYVRHLILEPGANMTLDNCRVYYRAITNEGVQPKLIGCGALIQLPPPDAPSSGDDVCYLLATNLGTACTSDADCESDAVCGLKSRYLTLRPGRGFLGGEGEPFSIQVTMASAPRFASGIGDVWWVGPPEIIPNAPNEALRGATLQCTSTPYSRVWADDDLHVYGAQIVPEADYEVRMCDETGTACSPPLTVGTGAWGDVVSPFRSSGQPNFGDIASIVDKFRGFGSAPDLSRADLRGEENAPNPNIPDQLVTFADIAMAVAAFRGDPYPFGTPACP